MGIHCSLSLLSKQGFISVIPAILCKTLRHSHNTWLRSFLKSVGEAGKVLLKARGST